MKKQEINKNFRAKKFQAERLIMLMDMEEYTVRKYSDLVMVAPNTISGYRTGYKQPSIEIAQLIAHSFNTSLDFLYGWTDNPLPNNFECNRDVTTILHLLSHMSEEQTASYATLGMQLYKNWEKENTMKEESDFDKESNLIEENDLNEEIALNEEDDLTKENELNEERN